MYGIQSEESRFENEQAHRQPEPVSDWSDLTDEDQEKLASYDLLEMDARFAARRLCVFLQRFNGQMPAEAKDFIQKILNELLMHHLLAKDHKWLADMVRKLEAA